MSSYKDPNTLLSDLGIILEYGCAKFKNRPIRFLEEIGVLQVGDDDFDRWANSVGVEFDLLTPKGQRAFLRWVNK
jgi:hypothetical protein